MTKNDISNIAASVRARLLNLAKERGIEFNRMLLLYLQERFLYRLSRSTYRDQFVLKGGVLFYGAHQQQARPTKDVDLLARNLSNDEVAFTSCIKEIITIQVDDGIKFDSEISIEKIFEAAQYEGLRIKLKATLDKARLRLQVDIGFSDKIIPPPVPFEYPTLIDDEAIPLIAYSWESVIAEKFDAMVKLGVLNSRLRDFYDIYFLLTEYTFRGVYLTQAIRETFTNRNTDIAAAQSLFEESFMNNRQKQQQWKAFMKKAGVERTLSFADIVLQIEKFLAPVIEAIQDNWQFNQTWDHVKQKWH